MQVISYPQKMVMDFVKKNILNVYMPVIYFYAYCFFAFEVESLLVYNNTFY